MKAIRASNRLFFINLLCLLWLPYYCDIKENEADIQSIQINKIVSSVSREIENVPAEQEKENKHEDLVTPVDKLPMEPNVEYVNSVENKKVDRNEEIIHSPSPQKQQSSVEVTQQAFTNLESSRPKSVDIKEKTVLHRNLDTNAVESKDGILDASANQGSDLIQPSLSAPHTAHSATRHVDTLQKSTEATPGPAVEPPKPDEMPEKEVKTEQPYHIPLNPEKSVLESIHSQPHYDGMPSFDEWKKMMLAEQEKGGQKVPSPTLPGKKISSQKRRRNYSSYECGAKIVASNSESEGTGRILNELVDEYMLNPCKAKIWFVIELCETVQATQIELANFELFSSCPRDFAVYSSDNFPTRDWVLLGTFTAAEQRVLQSFELKQEGFGKFVKIELLSYYGKEHYCPLSVVRIFGTSMVDEYEEMETLASQPPVSEDYLDRLDISMEDKKSPNILISATDAVMNIVKKAAEALGQHPSIDDGPINDTRPDQQNASEAKLCKTMDSSSNKCEEISVRTKKESQLHNFSPSSMHHSLFRLLHRCDQCASSRIRYYSSAQPHCRFFQAAFGPAVMQGLCDWLKEHPLVFAHESSAHRKNDPQLTDPTPTKSPPPQIMVVPLENDTSLKKPLDATNVTINLQESDETVNATKTAIDNSDILENKPDAVHLDPSIHPTYPQKSDYSFSLNDSQKSVPFVEFSEAVLPSADAINDLPNRPILIVPEGANLSTDKSIAEIETVATESPSVVETFTDVYEEQIKEFIPDSAVMGEDLSLSEDLRVPVTELPVGVKVQEMGEKLEPVPVSSVTTAGQKESVFMRMSNRIKSLELNMSLSSQYLQELSQRYRRQMEDMQRAFNRTIGTLNDTAKKAAERDLRQQDALNTLQLQVANLTQTVEILLNERSTVFREMVETHVCLMVIEAIIMVTVMSLCVRRISSSAGQVPPPLARTTGQPASPEASPSPRLSKRRSSADSCTSPVARKVKRRSASEEAIHAGEEVLIIEPLPVFLEPIKAKKKNRKRSKLLRSASNPIAQRRSSSPTSQSTTVHPLSHSEGCVSKNSRLKHHLHRKNHLCENCSDNTCSELRAGVKKRLNGAPLQNLTNGTIPGSQEARNQRLPKGERKFSFRKFLRFQKRDSI